MKQKRPPGNRAGHLSTIAAKQKSLEAQKLKSLREVLLIAPEHRTRPRAEKPEGVK